MGDLSYGPDLVGGKGYNLQRLMHANFHVPSGFIVSTDAYRVSLRRLLAEDAGWEGMDDLPGLIERSPLPTEVEEEIVGAVRALGPVTGTAWVVRSSATSEDHEHSSMAGQAASFVNVLTEEDLLRAVVGCWASLFSRESIVYRSCHTGTLPFPEMAVVVQQLVPAYRAGVVFTLNPVSGDVRHFLASASWGLGETVVSGRAADLTSIHRDSGAIVTQEVARKTHMVVPARGGGTRRIHVPRGRRDQAVVDSSFAASLADVARRVEGVFGRPQDLEWAEWDGRVYLLQTRPVTTGRIRPRRSIWSSTNVGEALPGVATPFTWSIIHSFSRQGLTYAFRGLGCEVPDSYAIVGNVRGRVFLNISEFMSVASQVPFATPDMLQRLAGGGGAEELEGTYRRLPRTRFLVRLPLTAVETVVARAVTPARVALWAQKFKRFSREFTSTRMRLLPARGLLDLWARTDGIFEQTGTLLMECSGQFLMSYMVTSLALRGLYGERGSRLERRLFSGLSGIRSAEPGLDLLRMARRVSRMPGLRDRVLEIPAGELLATLESGTSAERSLFSAFEAFLRSHGHRAAREAEISEPRWKEDPTFPAAMLAKYLETEVLPDPEAMIRTRIERREETTRRVLARTPAMFRRAFAHLLSEAQEAARLREDLRNSVVRAIGFFRTLALEAGRRLQESGILHLGTDVFFLRVEELLAWLRGETTAGRLPLMAAMRKLEHRALSDLPDPPTWFVMEGDRILPRPAREASGVSMTGLAGSPGRATGRAVVVRDPSQQAKVKPGDILVAPFTDVGWTPLFLIVAGVVSELGGPLSHSCVVAREYGVPAVVNVKDAARLLKDGDLVTVDGDSGNVVVQR